MSELNDPTLKSAIKELRGKSRATEELRQKIAARLREGGGASGGEMRVGPKRTWRPLLAAAAVLVLIGGAVILYVQWGKEDPGTPYAQWPDAPYGYAYAPDDGLIEGMIGVQKRGSAAIPNETAVAAAMGDPAGIAGEATGKLSRPVPTVTIADGWTLDAVSICDISAFKALRMHYTRGKEGITFVSLPAAAWRGGREGATYERRIQGHPIAGYIKAGSLNCVVGDTAATLDEVIQLRNRIQGS